MSPSQGYELTSSPLEDVTPTTLLAAAVVTATSALWRIGVDPPSPTWPSVTSFTALSTLLTIQPVGHNKPTQQPDNGECKLLGPFSIIIQGALGFLALLSLVYKRWRERPQRPLKIWFFDVSKQVVGSVLVHVANLLMSMLSSGQFSIKINANTIASFEYDAMKSALDARSSSRGDKYTPNPCSFYLLNLAIDTTIGIPILIITLRVLTALFSYTSLGKPPQSVQSGNYGSPPSAKWWGKQSFIYFIGLMIMKCCVLVIFVLAPWISRVGDWALRWTEGDEALQVIFVMLVFPVIMNATQYYIIDTFIKNQKPDHESIADSDENDYDGRYREDVSESEQDTDVDDGGEDTSFMEDHSKKTSNKAKGKATGRENRSYKSVITSLKSSNQDYDPAHDGEDSPTILASSSEGERHIIDSTGRLEGKELKG